MTPLEPESFNTSGNRLTQIRAQLDRLLNSPLLQSSPRRQRLLRYIVEATLAGKADRLKGYTLGVEVFDRGAGFDPNVDPIVRVEMGRLRSKLIEYYSGAGSADAVLIELPKGAYAARMTFRADGGKAAEAGRPSAANPEVDERPWLAVLPFANLSADPEQEFFADGITEDLITDLSKLSGLSVISRHSSFVYKRTAKSTKEIGVELGVGYVLEGSVRRAADTMRITAQLIDARSGAQLWGERYDRPACDVFAVQDDVTRKIVAALAVSLSPLESARVGHEGTASLEAHENVLRGLQQLWVYTEAANRTAQAFFERAVELDRDYAEAHAWLARSLVFDYAMRWAGSDQGTLDRALRHAQAAVDLDGLLAFAHAVRCWAELWAHHGAAALDAGQKAIALDASNSDARLFLSLSLSAGGEGAEALRQIEIGMALNPSPSTLYHWARGVSLMLLGRYQEALADFKAGIHLRAAFLPNLLFATWACINLGRMKDAHRYRDAMATITGANKQQLRNFWNNADWKVQLEEALQQIGFVPEEQD